MTEEVDAGDDIAISLDEEDVRMKKAVVTLPRIIAALSFIGSAYICWSLVGTKAARRKSITRPGGRVTFNRFLLGLAVGDMIASFGFFLMSWPIPKYNPDDEALVQIYTSEETYYEYFPGASGTFGTCTAQGFVIQLGTFMSVVFMGFIGVQYVLTVRYSWRDAKLKPFERNVIAFAVFGGIISATVPAATKAMNAVIPGYCWIAPYPAQCIFNSYYEWCQDEPTARGLQAYTFRTWFATLWIATTMVVVLVSMSVLFWTVRQQEKRAARFSDAAREGRAQKKVIFKAFLYLVTYLLTYAPAVASLYICSCKKYRDLITMAFLPAQGIFTFLIYSGALDCFVKKRSNNQQVTTSRSRFTLLGVFSSKRRSSSNTDGSPNGGGVFSSLRRSGKSNTDNRTSECTAKTLEQKISEGENDMEKHEIQGEQDTP